MIYKKDIFDQIFNVMEQSFPKNELREYDKQKRILLDNRYKIITKQDSNGKICGFLSFWIFEKFNFIEHLAVCPEFRGKGIGTSIMKTYFNQIDAPAVLEVETPDDDIKKRRINFYEKLGFKLNLYFYNQPSLIKGYKSVPMYIMSKPNDLSISAFMDIRKTLDINIYT